MVSQRGQGTIIYDNMSHIILCVSAISSQFSSQYRRQLKTYLLVKDQAAEPSDLLLGAGYKYSYLLTYLRIYLLTYLATYLQCSSSRHGISFCICLVQEDPEIPFTEDDYRRRKPHPNFKEHISAEKIVIKYGKTVNLHNLLPVLIMFILY